MDKRIDRFLNDHNLIQHRDNFLHFDFATFLNLNIEAISELIPPISDRNRLIKALNSFINGTDDTDLPCTLTENPLNNEVYEIDLCSIDEQVLPKSSAFIPRKKRKSTELLQLEHPSLTITHIGKIKKTESVNVAIKQEPQVIEIIEMTSDSDTDDENASCDIDVQMICEESTKLNTGENYTQQKNFLTKLIKQMDLKAIRDLDMNILFAIYNKQKSFNDHERTLLSEIIIKAILRVDSTLQLEKVQFHKLAKLVVKTFPQEPIKPYFKNIKQFNNPGTADKGTLHTAFTKYQAILATSGFTIAEAIPEPTISAHQPTKTSKIKPNKEVNTENALKKLKSAHQPTKTSKIKPNKETNTENALKKLKCGVALEYEFIRSRSKRFEMNKNDSSRGKFSTVKYVQMHKVLQTPVGYKLIMKDAEYLFPNLKGFVSNFVDIARNIIQYARGLNWTDPYVYKLLRHAQIPISEDNQKLMAILLLPYVLPKATIKRKDSTFDTSPLASAVQFIRLFRDKTEETQLYGKLFKEEPKFISGLLNLNLKLYGEFDNIYSIILRVGTVDYEFKNPLHAVEAYFKMFLGMNLHYPIFAPHIFYFFGILAFDVNRPRTPCGVYDCVVPFLKLFGKVQPTWKSSP